jgi:hypothetical protein
MAQTKSSNLETRSYEVLLANEIANVKGHPRKGVNAAVNSGEFGFIFMSLVPFFVSSFSFRNVLRSTPEAKLQVAANIVNGRESMNLSVISHSSIGLCGCGPHRAVAWPTLRAQGQAALSWRNCYDLLRRVHNCFLRSLDARAGVAGYSIERLMMFGLFPQTHYLETVARLWRSTAF